MFGKRFGKSKVKRVSNKYIYSSAIYFFMEIVYYKRNALSETNMHAGSYARCFFVPAENVLLYREQNGSFGGENYSITYEKEILQEANKIANGIIPDVTGVTFSDIKKFEYEKSRLQKLIKDARLKAELQTKVEAGIEALLKKIQKSKTA